MMYIPGILVGIIGTLLTEATIIIIVAVLRGDKK